MKLYIKSNKQDEFSNLKSMIIKSMSQSELSDVEDQVNTVFNQGLIGKGDRAELMRLINDTRDEIMYGLNDEEDELYKPSATNRDYSPSSPWNAPGMSVRDFI